jgi:hypothetical protein
MIRILRLILILCSGLVVGLTLTHVLQSPGSAGLSARAWLDVQHTFYGGFAIVGGVCEIVALLSAVALAILHLIRREHRAAIMPAVVAVCFVGALVAFAVGNEPVNAQVASWTPTTIPPDWRVAVA